MPDDQRDVIAFLGDPSSYGPAIGAVERLETHISLVFLAGERAYKLKRAITFSYLDFSTVEQRRRAGEAELRLNRRTAPHLYLELRPIARGAGGGLAWGDDGEIVDWVVVMRRFGQDRLLDAVAARGGLNPSLLFALAAHIAEFHAKADPRPNCGGSAAMAEIAHDNEACLKACLSVAFSPAAIAELGDRSREWLARLGGLLDRRREDRKVRRCHGDLHLRNIYVIDDKPVLFDCLEFSERLASIDVLYDLAFLLMDLAHREHSRFANLVFNRYLDLTQESDGLAAMPLFLSLRAAIRAHVTANAPNRDRAGADAAAEEARRYLDQACAALRPPLPRLVAVGGLSGTGKSTLAAGLAAEFGARPGARVLRSDVIRKRLYGLDPEAAVPQSAYKGDVTDRVYEAIRDQAAAAMDAGYCVIVDAVALKEEERRSFATIARQAGVPFSGLWLEAPADALVARVGNRHNDASDATAEIVELQLGIDPGLLDWRRIHAGKDPEATLAAARKSLDLI